MQPKASLAPETLCTPMHNFAQTCITPHPEIARRINILELHRGLRRIRRHNPKAGAAQQWTLCRNLDRPADRRSHLRTPDALPRSSLMQPNMASLVPETLCTPMHNFAQMCITPHPEIARRINILDFVRQKSTPLSRIPDPRSVPAPSSPPPAPRAQRVPASSTRHPAPERSEPCTS